MKESFFLSRVVVFHLTGAPVAKLSEHIPAVAACWNESVRGRKAADVASAWLSILMEHRDADTIDLKRVVLGKSVYIGSRHMI